jgi:hypothetical protein
MESHMKDWKTIAAAMNLNIPEGDLDALVPALATVEKAFRPLARTIPMEVDPAVAFSPTPGEAEESE